MHWWGVYEIQISQLGIGSVEWLNVVQNAETREGRQIVMTACGETTPPDVDYLPVATFRGACAVPFGLFVNALRRIRDERQICSPCRVPVGSARERRELTLHPKAIVLETRALVVAGETEALQFLRLSSEGRTDRNDVVKLLYFRFLA